MVRFFCPGCWTDFGEDLARCPVCELDIHHFWSSKDYVQKLIVALNHPEKGTPVRAAWILGQIRDPRAVDPLMTLVQKTKDVYIAAAAIKALGKIGGLEATNFLKSLQDHPAQIIREAAEAAVRNLRHPEVHRHRGTTTQAAP